MSRLSNSKKSTLTNYDQSSFQKTALEDKIVQCWLRQNHEQYQQLLIDAKQLQIQLLQQQTKSRGILKIYDKKKIQVDQLEQKLNIANNQLNEKKNYLNKYYQHLNNKLKSETTSINLVAKIEALTANLNQKLEKEKKKLSSFVVQLRQQIQNLQEEKTFLNTKKENLKTSLVNLKQAKQNFKSEEQKKYQEQKKRKIQEKQQYQYLQVQLRSKNEQKKNLLKNQNILKKLLNIEQVHKKHWLLIQKAIKNQFTYLSTQKYYKQAVNQQLKQKIEQKQSQISQRKYELQILREQLESTNKKANSTKTLLQQKTKKFNEVQLQLLNMNQPR